MAGSNYEIRPIGIKKSKAERLWIFSYVLLFVYSTVTLLARLRGWSTSNPFETATW